jgi:hypothetical protein
MIQLTLKAESRPAAAVVLIDSENREIKRLKLRPGEKCWVSEIGKWGLTKHAAMLCE